MFRIHEPISVRNLTDRIASWKQKAAAARLSWGRLFTQAVLAAFAYAFMEWLFFATKPSFMDAIAFTNKLEILFIAGLVLAGGVLGVLLPLRILGWMPGPTNRGQIFLRLGALIPAATAASLSLLLIDNFTYTVFTFGIITSQGAVRAGYAIFAVILLLFWYRQTLRWVVIPAEETKNGRMGFSLFGRTTAILATALMVVSLLVGSFRILTAADVSVESGILSPRRPHIILITGEGLDSKNMSLYGYSRDTTPNLNRLSITGLLAENDYTNAAHTTGSVVSMLTGKYPATTRLIFNPNILQGEDSLEHLPGILRRAGYTNVQIAFPEYVDAYNENMQEAFDEVNGRALSGEDISRTARILHWEDAGYLLTRLWERISDRLLHIFFIRKMPDPYREAIQSADRTTTESMTDKERLEHLLRILREAEGPVFAHVHLMETHGPKFYPRTRVFSVGRIQDHDWTQVFYDDGILDFDAYIGEFVADLKTLGVWENTVLVITTDHVDRWRTNERIPLLFHFPGVDYTGRIHNNTQTLDIAPTLLDYLGMQQPAWMPGLSLLQDEPPALRPIYSTGVVGAECGPPDWLCDVTLSLSRPPFYYLGYVQVVVCQEMDTLVLRSGDFYRSTISDHTAPCLMEDLPSPDESRRLILEYLRDNGYDVSSLE